MIHYISTRGGAGRRSFEEVLLAGLAEDGGLFVPECWPTWSHEDLQSLQGLTYAETAVQILKPFVEGCFDEAELRSMCDQAYGGFDHAAVAPLKQMDHDIWVMELFHGPTLAFKDFALQLLGLMFEKTLKRQNRRMSVVGATSGDTGAAALAACAGLDAVDIAILHPKGRVSEVQRRQMTTINANNVLNIALEGTFDDCQDLVKAMFNDRDFRSTMQLGAINSINWARVLAQTVYYFYAAVRLGNTDRPPVFTVPTGNFGDIFAGYAAMKMGLPVKKLLIATNKNDILTRFWQTGRYEVRGVAATNSPSMDIQVASNFERYLFDLEERSDARVRGLMASLKQDGGFEIEPEKMAEARTIFGAGAADEGRTRRAIQQWYQKTGIVLDPHTAVGIAVAEDAASNLARGAANIVLATASPAKFGDAVRDAVGINPALPPRLADLHDRAEQVETVANDLLAVQSRIKNRFRVEETA